MSAEYPSRHLNGMEEDMAVDTNNILIGEDGSITFPFIDEKQPKKMEQEIKSLEMLRDRLVDITDGDLVNVGLLAHILDGVVSKLGGTKKGIAPLDFFVNDE